jgi:hypothetical protein
LHLTRLQAFLRLPARRKRALCEAAVSLAAAQFLVAFVPYPRWAPLLGPIVHESVPDAAVRERAAASEVAWAVETAARHLPWNAVCLPRAMAAKWMLARRKVPSTLHLGVRPLDGRTVNAAALHAWLSVGREVLIGGEVAERFSALVRYGPR